VSTTLKVYVITGASRGLGLEAVRQLADVEGNWIFAAARNPDSASDLKSIQAKSNGRVELVTLDVNDKKSIDAAAGAVSKKTKHVDVLINSAGVASGPNYPGSPEPVTDAQDLLPIFQTNVVGVQLITQAFLPLLKAAIKNDGKDKQTSVPKVVNITSGMGSIAQNTGGLLSYRVSKAALNMLTSTWAIEVPEIAFLPISPGWVDTDMGQMGSKIWNKKPPLTPEQSIQGVLNVIDKATLEVSGKTGLSYDGSTFPW